MSIAEAAETYASMGLTPIRLYGIANGRCTCSDPECKLKNAGKHPVGKGWQKDATNDLDSVRDIFRGHRGNIGIYLGNQYVLIDVDGEGGPDALKSLGELPETMHAISGSGKGEHLIFKLAPHHDPALITDRQKAIKVDGRPGGIDVKIRGQFVAPPSVHISGGVYRWLHFVPPAVLPDSLYEKIKTPIVAPTLTPKPAATPSGDMFRRMRNWLNKAAPAVSGEGGHNTAMAVASKVVAQGLSEDEEWVLLVEWNQRCKPPWSERELRHKHEEAKRVGKGTPLEDRPAPRLSVVRGDAQPTETVDESWKAHLLWLYSSKGQKLVKTADNVVVILSFDPRWAGKIYLDTFVQDVVLVDPPWAEHLVGAKHTGYWTDTDTARLQAWLMREYNLNLPIGDLDRAVAITAERVARSSSREWMQKLEWDQVKRLDSWLVKYLGAVDTPYVRAVGRWWLISAVARTFTPGCKADHVLILHGHQGLGKSAALRTLAGADWFSDTAFDIGSKDAYVGLRGRLVVEMAELDSLKRADEDRAKAFFTSPVDSFRAPYAKRMVSVPRQCVFAGTTNKAEMLKDDTGNRRYWPVTCTIVDTAGLAADREQIWAEAVEAYQEGAAWWPETDADREMCTKAQEAHHAFLHDEREDLINQWANANNVTEVTGMDVFEHCLKMPPEKWTKTYQMELAAILKRAGWEPKRSNARRYWLRVNPPSQVVVTPFSESLPGVS